ncbi:dipeptidase [Sphingomonas yantingensis]|uniref:Microsomal dipeptidase-like Zn-dependent dipeptidase n=1 Tax=Sphingomonas yantingensis TaxID=1241761 RepID=A0A7W9EHE9_9SPHN|nr:dipeptidase [Sphingomonas yantingensis]MBB5697994.1 microsomal dipeptidase-like Zn-dependent dipeptidase [Sphingomonas yantingensis]
MKRPALIALALLIAAATAFFLLAPGIAERSMNKIAPTPLPTVTPETKALHDRLTIADLHSDSLLWKRDISNASDQGHVDIPRLLAGNVAIQVFSSVTKTPAGQNYDANGADTDQIKWLAIGQLQPVKTWTSLLERSLWHATKLERAEARSNGRLRIINDPAELDALLADRARGRKVVGAILSVEGLQNIEGKLANLDKLYAAGFRMAGLAHFFDNEVAGSMHGLQKGGLTPLGRQGVRRMEALGMIVDVAHSSHRTVAEVLAIARRPVVSSHGGVQATCAVNRNLTDAEIRGIARTGGVVGVGYWDAAVCSTAPKAIVAAIEHVRDVAGIDHVGLGSDFDGSVTTGFDTARLAVITQTLRDRGFSDTDIAKVMGGNVVRLLRDGMRPLGPPSPPANAPL